MRTAQRLCAAIVGVGATAQGELPGRSAADIAAEAFKLGLDDAGLTKNDIDGLITCARSGMGTDTEMGQLLGLNPKYSATLAYGTCNFSIHLAAMAISAGLASTVALTYGTNQRTGQNPPERLSDHQGLHEPHGYLRIMGPGALALQRHKHLYGTTDSQFGQIAITQRANARNNPLAIFKDPLNLDDYLASQYIVRPLRRPDVTMVSDGGVAIIMTSNSRLSDQRQKPVHLRGMSQTASLRGLATHDNLMRPWLKDVADRVYEDAGIGPTEIDILYVQDPIAVWVLQAIEWFGFCPVGEGGAFLEDGHTRMDGSIPVNTNGGQLSESYMWGWLHVVELVRQLRGEAGPRQIAGAQVGMYCSTMEFYKGAASIFVGES